MENSPSQKSEIFDSPLITRGPRPRRLSNRAINPNLQKAAPIRARLKDYILVFFFLKMKLRNRTMFITIKNTTIMPKVI